MSKKAIPRHGRKRADIVKDRGLRAYSGDVPLGNTDPTMVQGILWGPGGGGLNRPPRGALKSLRGTKQ